jgi:hypothetical protein
VTVGKGVSVGTGVKVDMAKVGKEEGSITGAAGGATFDQLQARAARIKAKSGRVHVYFGAGFMKNFMFPPIEVRHIQAEYSTILSDIIFLKLDEPWALYPLSLDNKILQTSPSA